MSDFTEKSPFIRHYFVDEAGDPTLFNGKGEIIVGNQGCSRFFILGMLDVADPDSLSKNLDTLRAELLADPYFKDIPSMQPERRKTAMGFHAKDDIPEVRREVFNLLKKYDLRFFAVVRDKQKLLEYVRGRNRNDASYRYQGNELYDYLTRRLFKSHLHQADSYNICFASRGKSDRTAALRTALQAARDNFCQQRGIVSVAPINITATRPPQSPCLQAVDYFLWVLQRLYERREDEYLEHLWSAFRLVHDLDDTRCKEYGVYYNQRNPISLLKMPEI